MSLSDINAEGLDAALKTLDGKGHFATVLDVRNASKVNEWMDETVRRLGGLDGAANIAGVERED